MKSVCAWCIHYNPQSYLVRTTERNISGNKVWYRRQCKNRCSLRQEDVYPNGCSFELDLQKLQKAEERYGMKMSNGEMG